MSTLRFLSIASVMLLWAGCSTSEVNLSVSTSNLSDVSIGTPSSFSNLTIFPLISKETRTTDRFITLDEGLKSGQVEILEGGAVRAQAHGNTVNQIFVVNRSDKHLYLMPGEILLGGDQDRMTSQETIIPPSEKPIGIAAFCVERGRWGSRNVGQTVQSLQTAQSNDDVAIAAATATQELAQQANAGKFVATVGAATKDVRIAAQLDKDQSKVWANVGKTNKGNSTESSTSTFTKNYVDKNSIEKIKRYSDHFRSKLDGTEKIVGVVVAINGKIHCVDAFESTPLFRKLWPRLLKSYALDAITKSNAGVQVAKCTKAQVREFLDEMTQAKVETETQNGTLVDKRQLKMGVSFSSRWDEKKLGASDFAGAVHDGGLVVD